MGGKSSEGPPPIRIRIRIRIWILRIWILRIWTIPIWIWSLIWIRIPSKAFPGGDGGADPPDPPVRLDRLIWPLPTRQLAGSERLQNFERL